MPPYRLESPPRGASRGALLSGLARAQGRVFRSGSLSAPPECDSFVPDVYARTWEQEPDTLAKPAHDWDARIDDSDPFSTYQPRPTYSSEHCSVIAYRVSRITYPSPVQPPRATLAAGWHTPTPPGPCVIATARRTTGTRAPFSAAPALALAGLPLNTHHSSPFHPSVPRTFAKSRIAQCPLRARALSFVRLAGGVLPRTGLWCRRRLKTAGGDIWTACCISFPHTADAESLPSIKSVRAGL